MNTWRDIKEAPLNQAVFATDGDMVFFGRFAVTADGKCMFEGQDIEEACNYGIEPACLTGWQPVPDTWKPEKSADEMFRELGYKSVESGYLCEYRKTEPNGTKIRICVAHGNNMQMTCSGKPFWMISEEVFACAQLIREMEANNG